jgi:predicted PurR-regulated permease PerM
MKDLKLTNALLLIIVIPLVFYLLKTLSFIFIPLSFAMFLALMFVPLMRWLTRNNVPQIVGIIFVIAIIFGVLKAGGFVIKLSINEIVSAQDLFLDKAQHKIVDLVKSVESFFGVERLQDENMLKHYLKSFKPQNFGSTLGFISQTISMTLMTAFFVVLLLSESINFKNIMQKTIFGQSISSVKAFIKIEKDIITFVKVKFIISLFTGIGFSLACMFFDVSFPIFWGLLAFLINFVQMIGSIVSVILLALFAFIELDPTGTLLFFILTITAVQVLMGGILEPIFMGQAFSLNVVTVLVMLMLWSYIWGVPGLIMAIPITVFIKIILEQSPKTKVIAELMSGSNQNLFSIKRRKKKKS